MRRLGLILWLVLVISICLAGVALAHDCSSPSDCEQTAGYNAVIAVTGGAIAAGAGLVGAGLAGNGTGGETPPDGGGDEEGEKEEPDHNPCAQEKTRMELASGRAKMLNGSLAKLRAARHQWETAWEDNRQNGYWSATTDLAVLAGSVWGRVLGGAGAAAGAATASAARVVAGKLVENLIVSMGKEVVMNIERALAGQGMTWEDVVAKPLDPAGNIIKVGELSLQEVVQRGALQEVGMELMLSGVDKDSAAYLQAMAVAEQNYAAPMANLIGDMVSLVQIGSGWHSTATASRAIRGIIRKLDDALFRAEMEFEDAKFEMELARDAYNHCLEWNPKAADL